MASKPLKIDQANTKKIFESLVHNKKKAKFYNFVKKAEDEYGNADNDPRNKLNSITESDASPTQPFNKYGRI